jgi:glycosyltransferase involved in cell wall biosynthesis
MVAPCFTPSTGKPSAHVAKGLKDRGHDVSVITSDISMTYKRLISPDDLPGVKIIRRRGYIVGQRVEVPRAIIDLLSVKADVLYLDGWGHTITTAASIIGKLRGIPTVMRADWNGRFAKGWKRLYEKCAKMPAINNCTAVTLFSNEQKEALQAAGVKPEKLHVLPNGVDYRRFSGDRHSDSLRQKFGIPDDATVFIAIARINPGKNQELAVRAAIAAGRNVHLVIVGEVEDQDYYRKLTGLANEQIHFHPQVRHEEVHKVYAAADVFVLPSKPIEGMNNATIEAMAAGLPVITTQVSVTPSIVKEAGCGFVIDDNEDPAEMAQAMRKLTDEGLRAEMAVKARKHAQNYSWDVLLDRFDRIIRDAAGRP